MRHTPSASLARVRSLSSSAMVTCWCLHHPRCHGVPLRMTGVHEGFLSYWSPSHHSFQCKKGHDLDCFSWIYLIETMYKWWFHQKTSGLHWGNNGEQTMGPAQTGIETSKTGDMGPPNGRGDKHLAWRPFCVWFHVSGFVGERALVLCLLLSTNPTIPKIRIVQHLDSFVRTGPATSTENGFKMLQTSTEKYNGWCHREPDGILDPRVCVMVASGKLTVCWHYHV